MDYMLGNKVPLEFIFKRHLYYRLYSLLYLNYHNGHSFADVIPPVWYSCSGVFDIDRKNVIADAFASVFFQNYDQAVDKQKLG